MVNVLIVDDNIYFAKSLMNYINQKNQNIRVCGLIEDGQTTLNILNNKNNIDIILLDYKIPIYNGDEVLKKIKDEKKYEKSCIVVTGIYEARSKFYNNNMVYKVIDKTSSLSDIIENINELVEYKETLKHSTCIKNKIILELVSLGYNISHNGTLYLVDTILYIYNNKDKDIDIDNLTKNIYPIIANKYKKSVHNIKCSIVRETNEMYTNCKIEKLKKYFYYSDDIKPNVKTVINTIINRIL